MREIHFSITEKNEGLVKNDYLCIYINLSKFTAYVDDH